MSGLVKRKFYKSFTANDTAWAIPNGVTMLWIECIGAGGGAAGGAYGASSSFASGGTGGAGGSMTYGIFDAPALSATLNIGQYQPAAPT